MANRATETIRQYVASVRRFEDFAGMEQDQSSYAYQTKIGSSGKS